jgi:hypothetical protein
MKTDLKDPLICLNYKPERHRGSGRMLFFTLMFPNPDPCDFISQQKCLFSKEEN